MNVCRPVDGRLGNHGLENGNDVHVDNISVVKITSSKKAKPDRNGNNINDQDDLDAEFYTRRYSMGNKNRDAAAAAAFIDGAASGFSNISLLSAASSILNAAVPMAPSAIDESYLRVVKLHILVFEIGAATLEAEMEKCVRKQGFQGWKDWLGKNEAEARR